MKPIGSVHRVLFVEDEGLSQPRIDGILDLSPQTEYVRAGSLREARRLLESESFDVVVARFKGKRGITVPGGTGFGKSALRFDGKIFAMFVRDEFVVVQRSAR